MSIGYFAMRLLQMYTCTSYLTGPQLTFGKTELKYYLLRAMPQVFITAFGVTFKAEIETLESRRSQFEQAERNGIGRTVERKMDVLVSETTTLERELIDRRRRIATVSSDATATTISEHQPVQ
ncbi:hypothetical protein MPSEU_000551400 [Mayamaea pseudoterrestris]|nr:hypothetical protein MPSEU_000551400 [Mayamaea pseudoterrestris]